MRESDENSNSSGILLSLQILFGGSGCFLFLEFSLSFLEGFHSLLEFSETSLILSHLGSSDLASEVLGRLRFLSGFNQRDLPLAFSTFLLLGE